MKKKLIFYIDSYSEYLNDFIEQLQPIFNTKVVLTKKNHQYANYNFKYKKRYNLLNIKKNSQFIKNFNPDVIIVGGIKHPLSQKFLEIKKKRNVKLYFWLERIEKNFLFKYFFYYIYYKNLIKLYDGVFAIGREAFNFYLKFNKNTINLTYNINLKFFDYKKKKYKKNLKILYAGQLIKRKGLYEIIQSFDYIPKNIKKKIILNFVGNGPLFKLLKEKEKNYPFIKVKKFQSRLNLKKLLNTNDIFIYPSIYDGWAVAPMEAMASGMVVIISENCGFAEYIRDNFNGFVIKPKSKDIAEKITYLSKNIKKMHRISKEARNLIANTTLNSKNASKLFQKEIMK